MKISWIKYREDKDSFKILKNLGLDVFEVEDLDKTDHKIKELVDQNYNTIILSNEIANFSEDIFTKYMKDKNINIIIAPNKKNE